MTDPTLASRTEPVSDSTARKSSLLVGAVFLLIALWNFYKGRQVVCSITGGLGGCLILIGFFAPPAARAFHAGWMRIAVVLGWINSRILLGAMYWGVMTPMGLVLRLLGRNPLDRRGAARESYWVERTVTRQPREQFERLF